MLILVTSPETSPPAWITGQPPLGHGHGHRSEHGERPGFAGPAQSIGPGEKEETGACVRAARAGWARLGRVREIEFSFYSFMKILNSIKFCLFYCEISRAPKILKIFV
jgi:hypothetical protein